MQTIICEVCGARVKLGDGAPSQCTSCGARIPAEKAAAAAAQKKKAAPDAMTPGERSMTFFQMLADKEPKGSYRSKAYIKKKQNIELIVNTVPWAILMFCCGLALFLGGIPEDRPYAFMFFGFATFFGLFALMGAVSLYRNRNK